MLERFVIAARRYVRKAPAALLTIAVASYGALLWQAHVASTQLPPAQRYVQLFGSAATNISGAYLDPLEETLFLDADDRSVASATWRLNPGALRLPRAPRAGSVELFIAGPEFAYVGPRNRVRIQIDRSNVVTFRVPNSTSNSNVRLRPISMTPDARIDVPPRITPGFRFLIAPGACPPRGCTLRITTSDMAWSFRRVGLLYTFADVAGPPLWNSSGAWITIFVASALAAISHLVLSLRKRSALPRLG